MHAPFNRDRIGILPAAEVLTSAPSATESDFNAKLLGARNETISELLGKRVLVALHEHLLRHHAISTDEIPYRYRLDTLVESLESVFSVVGALSMGNRMIAAFLLTPTFWERYLKNTEMNKNVTVNKRITTVTLISYALNPITPI